MKQFQKIVFCAIFPLFFATNGFADNEKDSIVLLAETVNRFNRVFPQEKVYLHFDNTGYFVDETIWFKAYMVRSDNDSLGSLSRVLYVELVSPYGDVVKTQKLKVVDGTAHGEIVLNELMTSGYYEVRAYTRYMLNWGKDAIFSRVIPIFEKPNVEGDYSKPVIDESIDGRSLPDVREQSGEKMHKINVKFYPEGGRMVREINGRVAFSLTDKQGRAVNADCQLRCGEAVLSQVSVLREGRGVFEFTPDNRKTMLRVILENGKYEDFEIPVAEGSGCVLTADVLNDEEIGVTLSASPDLQGQTVGIIWMQGGHMYDWRKIVLGRNKKTSFSRTALRAGVNQLTVIDERGRILAHRMIFVFPHKEVSLISMTPKNTKTVIGKKDVMEITALPNTSFSMSIVDATSQTGGRCQNAATWLLLTSDLKGYIKNPEYYFESDDQEHRRNADLLMMVQGWRRYDFQMMEGKKMFVKSHSLEDKLYIDGKLNKYKRKKGVNHIDLSVLLTNKLGDQLVGQTVTSEKGYYAFELPDCYRDWDMTIATKKDDKFEKYYVGINRHFSPEARQLQADETEPIELDEPTLQVVQPFEEGDSLHWKTNDVQVLQEVKVKGKMWRNPRDFWERESREARNATLRYDCTYAADELLDHGQPVPTLIDYLKQKNPLLTGNDNLSGIASYYNLDYNFYDGGLRYGRRPIIWIVNNRFFCATGMPAKYVKEPDENDHLGETPLNFPSSLDEVKRVYFSLDNAHLRHFGLLRDDIMGLNCAVAFVYTYRSALPKVKKGIRLTHFEGFNVPKEYEQEMVTGLLPEEDFRRTLYWNPDVRTDSEGRATIEFLNRPLCKMMNVSAEGIAADGKALIYK